jgi:hypothetical protein
MLQIQPDMISLDPEFVGTIAPPSKLTKGDEVPFARLPRQARLKLQNRADETEDRSEEEGEGDVNDQRREEKEKKKMRGRGKALKRYLRKQRKNVIDPQTVINCPSLSPLPWKLTISSRSPYEPNLRRRRHSGRKSEMLQKALKSTDCQVL